VRRSQRIADARSLSGVLDDLIVRHASILDPREALSRRDLNLVADSIQKQVGRLSSEAVLMATQRRKRENVEALQTHVAARNAITRDRQQRIRQAKLRAELTEEVP
jgi:hypothetical protein